jgi:hypothetical protein
VPAGRDRQQGDRLPDALQVTPAAGLDAEGQRGAHQRVDGLGDQQLTRCGQGTDPGRVHTGDQRSLAASQTNRLLATSAAETTALTNGYQLSFAIGGGLVLVALAVAGTVLRSAGEDEEGALRAGPAARRCA